MTIPDQISLWLAKLTPQRLQRLNQTALALMLLYLVLQMGSSTFLQGTLNLADLKDYKDAYIYSLQVAQEHRYEWFFGYPPSFVILKAEWPWAESAAGVLLWMCVLLLGAYGAIRLSAEFSGLAGHPLGYGIVFMGFIGCSYFLEWDLQNLNFNLSYLGLILLFMHLMIKADQHPRLAWLAGVVLALSIVLKIYSLCLLPYVVLKRRWTIFGAALAAGAIMFALPPLIYFGPDWIMVHQSWLEIFSRSNTFDFLDKLVAAKLSLYSALMHLRDLSGGGSGWLAGLSKQTAFSAWQISRMVWLGLICLYFLPQLRHFLDIKQKPRLQPLHMGQDLAMLMIASLAISPHFKAAQGALLFLPVCLMATGLAGPGKGRWGAVLFLLAMFLSTHETPSGPIKGIFILGLMLIMAGRFILRAWQRSGAPGSETDPIRL
jgi:hypothetical protein